MFLTKPTGARIVEVEPQYTATTFAIRTDTKFFLHKVWVDTSAAGPGHFGTSILTHNNERVGYTSFGLPFECDPPLELVGLRVLTGSAPAYCLVSGEVTKG